MPVPLTDEEKRLSSNKRNRESKLRRKAKEQKAEETRRKIKRESNMNGRIISSPFGVPGSWSKTNATEVG
jgi:hypothetical protein